MFSIPWDLHKTSQSLEAFPSSFLYSQRLSDNLRLVWRLAITMTSAHAGRLYRRLAHRHMHILKDSAYIIDWDRIERAQNVREFDAAYIVPMFGYQTVEEYYDGGGLMLRCVSRHGPI